MREWLAAVGERNGLTLPHGPIFSTDPPALLEMNAQPYRPITATTVWKTSN